MHFRIKASERVCRKAYRAAVLTLLGSAAGFAQNGAIIGTIRDTSDAVISRATISVVDRQQAANRETNSNENGDYLVAGLPPGTYTVSVQASGFEQYRITDLVLRAITLLENQANSSYNSLQLSRRRYVGRLNVSVAYTYSHSIDDSPDRFDSSFTTPAVRDVDGIIGPLLYNPAALVEPTGLTIGNSTRNMLNSPSRGNLDAGLFKNFAFSETRRLEFRAEAFNVFNHTQWLPMSANGLTSNNVTASCYGGPTGSAGDSGLSRQLVPSSDWGAQSSHSSTRPQAPVLRAL